jgi:hypothetical protein
MKQFKIWIAIVLLVASISVLVVMLFNPQPIQIILETGQEVSSNSNYFTTGTVMLLIICSFIIGLAITYLFYNSENSKIPSSKIIEGYDLIMPLLRDDEKKAVRAIREHNGEILQNELVLKLGLSKVKTTRILAGLERKQIIVKQRHGMTNSVKLKVK